MDLAAEEMARFDAEMGMLNLLPVYSEPRPSSARYLKFYRWWELRWIRDTLACRRRGYFGVAGFLSSVGSAVTDGLTCCAWQQNTAGIPMILGSGIRWTSRFPSAAILV